MLRLWLARGRDDLGRAGNAVFHQFPEGAKRVLEVCTEPVSRGLDQLVDVVRHGGRTFADGAADLARRHPMLNEARLTVREIFRQGGKHHTLRDELGRAVKLRLNEPRPLAFRQGAQTVVDLAGAGVGLVKAVFEPLTRPVLAVVNAGLQVTRKTSWIAAKTTPLYLSFEGLRGNLKLGRDPSALTRANLSTDPEHALFVRAYTLGTTQDAFIPASLSLFHSGPTVKGFNPTTGKVEFDQAVPTTFGRKGPDQQTQVASNLSWRASLGIAGLAWKLGPDLANFNGNAHVAFATLGASLRGEAGNIVPGQGFNIGGRAYAALGVLVRYSYESNFDYPALNLPGGFTDGRVIFDASRPVVINRYWWGGGHDPFADGQLTLSMFPLGLSGVVKASDGKPIPSTYVLRTLTSKGAPLRLGLLGALDKAFYGIVFGRNPEGRKAAQALKDASPGLYDVPLPWGGTLFKQVEQYDTGVPQQPDVMGEGGQSVDRRSAEDRVQAQIDRAERAPGPTGPWRGPTRAPRTQEQRVEDQLRDAERVRGPSPPARQIRLEPAPVVNPGVAGQFVVSPRQGANVRAAPGVDAPAVSTLRHGEPVLQTGPSQVDADGERWIPVVGRDQGRRSVTGFVREDLVVSHAAGDKGPEGRFDPGLERQGYFAVEVQRTDTLRDICLRHGVSEDEIDDVIALNHQIIDPDLIYPGDTVYLPQR